MSNNYFNELNAVNVGDKIEKKNGLSYLSWAWAWGEIKKKHPDANYTVYENKDGWNYFTDGRTGWVKTGVTVNGIEHVEFLPIMDFKNKSIPADSITSFDVNKAIQRSLTKACARHGLGLYIYAGEDLPEEPEKTPQEKAKETRAENKQAFEKRFSDMWDYMHKPDLKWSYDLDEKFCNMMKLCSSKGYEKEKCDELVAIFENLEKDAIPTFS
jgi:hypothetical protein